MTLTIRPETAADAQAIAQVTRAAFEGHPFSRQTEPFIITGLRRAGALSLSLVAEDGDGVVGHVAFSPVILADGSAGWYGVGPLSVAPARQRQGIGSALMRQGMDLLRGQGADGCILVGDPAFYRRLGFSTELGLTVEGVPAEYTLALAFGDRPAPGPVTFHPAFAATSD